MRKPTKSQIKKLDRQFQKEVIERDGECMRCGHIGEDLSAHHLIKRKYYLSRHDIRNGITLCSKCHIPWAERYPIESEKILVATLIYYYYYFKDFDDWENYKMKIKTGLQTVRNSQEDNIIL